jgi:hypothetical protein
LFNSDTVDIVVHNDTSEVVELEEIDFADSNYSFNESSLRTTRVQIALVVDISKSIRSATYKLESDRPCCCTCF